jgi:phosphohistidine phosphatase
VIKDLILWRHADAEIAQPNGSVEVDLLRELTPKGHRQAKRMARWLKPHMRNAIVLSSAAERAMQTAAYLEVDSRVDSAFNPTTSLDAVLSALQSLEHAQHKVILVGHQPWLGELVAHLTQPNNPKDSCNPNTHIKKGATWWLRRLQQVSSTQTDYAVFSVQTPSLLK